ncbi:MAG: class I SAM-dependent methyltransferase family protein [Candidatus Omnitrophica bacterium]|nr:class I SAM-dependent methyltransferase family protein [Candidatus Omnitrophota bacterium]
MNAKKLPTYEELSKPLTIFSYKWFKWGLVRIVLNTIGRLSKGIRIGFKYGFDSGTMLDYVYENNPQGWLFFGKLIDREYLNGPGWAGIRQRKIHLKQILNEAIQGNRRNSKDTIIMDVASGPGRYLIETMQEYRKSGIKVICRDMDETGLNLGRQLCSRLGIEGIKYEKADAFSLETLKNTEPVPNIIIVSGLYELFTNDDIVKKSMDNISAVLKPGDYFIFTNQPYHPQLELIARTLPNRLHEFWVMRLRSDNEVKSWATALGFKHVRSLLDGYGIFSVHLFQKI